MADSWGKIPSGVLQGNLYELGNFDQCLGVMHVNETGNSFKGQYCLAGIAPSQSYGNSKYQQISRLMSKAASPMG